jgi:hypothetical protein
LESAHAAVTAFRNERICASGRERPDPVDKVEDCEPHFLVVAMRGADGDETEVSVWDGSDPAHWPTADRALAIPSILMWEGPYVRRHIPGLLLDEQHFDALRARWLSGRPVEE